MTSGGEGRGRAVDKDTPPPQTALLPHSVHWIRGTLRAGTAAQQCPVRCLKEKHPSGHAWAWSSLGSETLSFLCISWPCRALVPLSCPPAQHSPPPSHLSLREPLYSLPLWTLVPLEGAISAASEREEAGPVNNSWGWEALISQAGPTRGPCAGLLSRGCPLYLGAQLVMQPAISQAEGEINFLVLHGREGRGRGEVPGSRSWDLSDFRLQRLNPLRACRKGRRGCCQPNFIIAAASTEGGGGEGQTDGRGSGAGAERGVVWKQGGRRPSQPGRTGVCSACQQLGPRGVNTGAPRTGAHLVGSGTGLGVCHTSHRAWHRRV